MQEKTDRNPKKSLKRNGLQILKSLEMNTQIMAKFPTEPVALWKYKRDLKATNAWIEQILLRLTRVESEIEEIKAKLYKEESTLEYSI
jgi:hypothetical protein